MSVSTLWKIKVDVHQVYNLLLPDSTELPDPYIAASLELPRSSRDGSWSVSSTIQRSSAKSKMSSGTFNSVMLFIANISDFDFFRVKILIRVHSGKKITQVFDSDGVLLGTTSFSLSKVYSQAKHWIPREWLPITSPVAPGSCRGYVLVSIGVYGPGDSVPSQLSEFQMLHSVGDTKPETSRTLMDKIVQTPETSFHHCLLIFNILRAENLPVISKVPSSGYLRVSFVGIQAYTRIVHSNANPAWNETIKIPVLVPSWDQYVLVEVFSKVGAGNEYIPPSSITSGNASSGDILLGSTVFDFDLLYKAGIQPTWFNLYNGSENEDINPSFANRFGSDYAGRVQVSASVARSSDSISSVVPFDPSASREPLTEEICVFVDVYEISFFDDGIETVPPEIWIQVQVGPNTFESEKIFNSEMTCILGDAMGRLPPVRVHLPVDRTMAYDLIVSICGGSSSGFDTHRLCYARVPVDKFLVSGTLVAVDPEWIKLSRVQSVGGASGLLGSFGAAPKSHTIVAVASVLASVVALRLDTVKFGVFLPPRPPRIPYDLQSYELIVSIHQACNLPISDLENLTTAYTRVTLAGVCAKTESVPISLYPVWNELLCIKVDLPKNPALRPDVLVEVLDGSNVLGFASIRTATLRAVGAPSWYKLQSTGGSLGVGQESFILCSSVLVDEGGFAERNPIPKRGTFTVDLLIVGVRLLRNFSVEHFNRIEVCWGRQRGNLKRRVITITTNDPIAGEGGQFNFCQPALLDLDLPVESIFQEFLEVRLLEQQNEGETGWWPSGTDKKAPPVERAIGYGYIHLNPCYTWITDSERDHYRNLFRMKTHEELRVLQEALAESSVALDSEARRLLRSRRKKTVTKKNTSKDELEMEYIENEIDALFGIDIARSNYLGLPMLQFNAVDTDSMFPARFKRSSKSGADSTRVTRRSKSIGALMRSAIGSTVTTTNSRFLSEFVWEPIVSHERSDFVRREIDTEIESELDIDQLPYMSIPLVTGSSTESFQVVGYLKARCRVREKSVDSSELLALQKTFLDKYLASSRLVCRLYVMRAEGIVPGGGGDLAGMIADSSTSSYFLWVRNVSGDLIAEYPTCSIKDDGSLCQDMNPEFNKCFQLPCSFPENSVLHIELYERRSATTSFSDVLIGSCMIDIENRWFHPKFQTLLNLANPNSKTHIPIETWTIRSADSAGIPKGKLKLWVEIMDQVTSMGRAIEMLPSPQPENLQVRIVLWRTRGIPNAEGEDQCHQGVSMYMQNLPVQSSDTHFGSQDGTGTFNWRFVLNPTVPTDDASIRIQIQHRPLIGISNVPIGEVTLDLSAELASVRKNRRGIDLPKTWVPLSHPAFIGKLRGLVEIQIRILTVEEARQFPVGTGRDPPNQDPYLDGEDPHLVQHRNALANTSFGRSMGRFIDALKSGLKWGTILFIIGYVISGIVSLVILLVSMGIIKF